MLACDPAPLYPRRGDFPFACQIKGTVMGFDVSPLLCFLIFFNIGGGGGNHLLDYIPSDYYWKSKNIEMTADTMLLQLQPPPAQDVSRLIDKLSADNPDERVAAARKLQAIGGPALSQLQTASQSEDPGVATLAATLISQINTASKPTTVRRLMAIRALGEMKNADALPMLDKLVGSKEPMVGEYASRSVAQIQDKPAPQANSTLLAGRRDDLAILPATSGAVGQASANTDFFPHDQIAKFIDSIKLPQRGVPGPGGQGVVIQNAERDRVCEQLMRTLLYIAETNGDIRFDAMTWAVADQVGPNAGWVVVVFRGVYDSAALAAKLPADLKPQDVNGIRAYEIGNFAVIPVSDDRLIVIGGAQRNVLPVDAVTSAIKTGKGGFADDIALGKIIKTIDTDGPLWLAVNVGDSYRPVPVLGRLDNFTLVGTRNSKGLQLKAIGASSNPQQAQTANATLSGGLNLIATMLRDNAAMREIGATAETADFLKRVSCVANGTSLTVTGNFPSAAAPIFLTPLSAVGYSVQVNAKAVNPPATTPP